MTLSLDTNVLIRLLTNDDPEQASRAADRIRERQVWVPKTVLLETEWVLRYSYGLDRATINAAFRKLFGLPGLQAEDRDAVLQALAWHEAGMDFADALHVASSPADAVFLTFDRDLAAGLSTAELL